MTVLNWLINDSESAIIPSECESLDLFTFEFDGYQRKYRIYLPEIVCNTSKLTNFVTSHTDWNIQYNQPFNPLTNTTTLPILAVFPGLTEGGQFNWNRWEWKTDADQYGFIVIIFDGGVDNQQLSWNAQSCCGYNRDNDINDVGFVHNASNQIITALQSQYSFLDLSLDKIIMYLVGHSNGGFMVDQLSWIQASYINNSYTIPFTASIAVSGYIYDNNLLDTTFSGIYNNCSTKSFPMFYIFGADDGTVNMNGCACDNINCCCGISDAEWSTSCVPVQDALQRWLTQNGCDAAISFDTDKETIIGADGQEKECLFVECGGSVPVALCTLKSTGHAVYSDPDVDFDDLKNDMMGFFIQSSCLKEGGSWDETLNSCQCNGVLEDYDGIYYCVGNNNLIESGLPEISSTKSGLSTTENILSTTLQNGLSTTSVCEDCVEKSKTVRVTSIVVPLFSILLAFF